MSGNDIAKTLRNLGDKGMSRESDTDNEQLSRIALNAEFTKDTNVIAIKSPDYLIGNITVYDYFELKIELPHVLKFFLKSSTNI